MAVRFSTFGDWYEVDSLFEGHFLESIDRNAFDQTIAENRDNMKVLYDHGQDPQIGNKVLGQIESLTVDDQGPLAHVPLFDTSYNRDLQPGLEAGAYGSSFRFAVNEDVWQRSPKASDYNPDALPERNITRASVMEFGPVTFPANPNATAGMRSTTDTYYKRSRDPEGYEALMRSAQVARSPIPAAPVAAPAPVQPTPKGTTVEIEYQTPEDRAARISELNSELARAAVEFPGVLPEAAQLEWDHATEELRKLEADSKAWEMRQAFLRTRAEEPKGRESGEYSTPMIVRTKSTEDIYDFGLIDRESRSLEDKNQRVKENALRSIESHKVPKGISVDALVDIVENKDAGEDGKGEIARRVLLTGSPAYRRYFNKYLKNQTALATPEEARAAALAVTGTTTTGGYAVPYIFDPTMIHVGAYTAQNPFRAACRVETITNGNNWRAVTVGNIAMAYGTEGAAQVEGGPTFAQPSYTVQTGSGFVTLSIEAMEDRPDITSELSSVLAEGKATLEENKFALGAGTTVYPQGMFLSGAYTVKTTATNDVTALLDFTATEGDLPLRFRQNAAWFMNRSTIRQLQILDTSYRYFSGAGIQYPGALNGQLNPATPPTSASNTGMFLLGYPIWEVPSAVSTLTTDAAVLAVLCDPSTYIIVDRVGMNIEVVPQMFDATTSFPTLQRGIVAWFRNTARVHTADGGRQVKVQ